MHVSAGLLQKKSNYDLQQLIVNFLYLWFYFNIEIKLSNITPRNVHVKTRTLEHGETRPMYEDLLRRRGDDQVYMAIDKASMDKTTVVGMDIDHYHTAQDVPGSQRYWLKGKFCWLRALPAARDKQFLEALLYN